MNATTIGSRIFCGSIGLVCSWVLYETLRTKQNEEDISKKNFEMHMREFNKKYGHLSGEELRKATGNREYPEER